MLCGLWAQLFVVCQPLCLLPCRRHAAAQILTALICVMTGLMCVVKNYVDVNILPFVGSHGKKHKKEKKKAELATGEPKKKAGSWELLTSSPRILNMTLMVRLAFSNSANRERDGTQPLPIALPASSLVAALDANGLYMACVLRGLSCCACR